MDPVLIMTAIITHLIYFSVFSNPFLALDGVDHLAGHERPPSIGDAMLSTYQLLLKRKSRSLPKHAKIRTDCIS